MFCAPSFPNRAPLNDPPGLPWGAQKSVIIKLAHRPSYASGFALATAGGSEPRSSCSDNRGVI
jgi:hypothetical protein